VVLTGCEDRLKEAAELGLTAHVVDEHVTGTYGITPLGAVLVRPDFVIAWRARGAEGDLKGALAQVLSQM
jgi:putative polyketide hydroxylase